MQLVLQQGHTIGSYIERIVGVGNNVVRVFCPADSPSAAEDLERKDMELL